MAISLHFRGGWKPFSRREYSVVWGSCAWRRFWPGVGSFAFAIIIRAIFAASICSVRVRGRSASVGVRVGTPTSLTSELSEANIVNNNSDHPVGKGQQPRQNYLNLLFIHGSHTDLQGSLFDGGALHRSANRIAPTLFLGDFNVDQLPVDPADPYKDNHNRIEHHRDRRLELQNMCKVLKFKLLPVHSCGKKLPDHTPTSWRPYELRRTISSGLWLLKYTYAHFPCHFGLGLVSS